MENINNKSESAIGEEENLCPICYDKFSLPFKLHCGHSFCYLCIKGSYLINKTCPMCRNKISEDLNKVSSIDVFSNRDRKYPRTQWIYGNSRGDAWWYYDDATNELIENLFSIYLHEKSDDKKDDTVSSNAKNPNKNSDDSESGSDEENKDSNSDSNSDSEEEQKVSKYSFRIGTISYDLNFEEMYQYPSMSRNRKRKIKRLVLECLDEEEDIRENLKILGVAGVMSKENDKVEK